MFLLLILIGLVAIGVYCGTRNAEMEATQWPKMLWVFLALFVLIGLGVAWGATLPWEQRAALSWVLVMFGPVLAIVMFIWVLAAIVEVVVRRRARRRAEREIDG